MPICYECEHFRSYTDTGPAGYKCRINRYKRELNLYHPESDGLFPYAEVDCKFFNKVREAPIRKLPPFPPFPPNNNIQ